MPLKLSAISQRIEEMVGQTMTLQREDHLEAARRLLAEADPAEVRARFQSDRVRYPWLIAIPTGTMSATFPASSCPSDFSVVATAGQQNRNVVELESLTACCTARLDGSAARPVLHAETELAAA